MSVVLITGSTGLVGSEAVNFFCKKGFDVIGIDNNLRKFFFGEDGSTIWIKNKLICGINYTNYCAPHVVGGATNLGGSIFSHLRDVGSGSERNCKRPHKIEFEKCRQGGH